MLRGGTIAAVFAKHGLRELFELADDDGGSGRHRPARRLRAAFEELGPTFAKLGQLLSTRPDLLPPEFVEELSTLRDHVPPLTEAEVVQVMEQELGVPWEDVFETIDREPLAAGTIAQVHRATLAGGSKVVVKVQRPGARDDIAARPRAACSSSRRSRRSPGVRPARRHVVDGRAPVRVTAARARLPLEASSIERMRGVILADYRARRPRGPHDLSSETLLVMQEIEGSRRSREAPRGEARARSRPPAARESYYKQLLAEGFFHADPTPATSMWWNDRLYFLDFGMVGEVGPEAARESHAAAPRVLAARTWRSSPTCRSRCGGDRTARTSTSSACAQSSVR